MFENHLLNVTSEAEKTGFQGIIRDVSTLEISFVPNNPPQIINVEDIGNVDLTPGDVKNVSFNFTVYDDLNSNSAKGNFTRKGVVRQNLSCVFVEGWGSYYANYSCTIGMQYFDGPGNWNVTVTIADNPGSWAVNDSETFFYNFGYWYTV